MGNSDMAHFTTSSSQHQEVLQDGQDSLIAVSGLIASQKIATQHDVSLADHNAETTNAISGGIESRYAQHISSASAERIDTSPEECRSGSNGPDNVAFNGGTLRGDLECVLGDFDFKGSHAYGGQAVTAPNPCLFISGLGLLGLPLSERDAKLMINCAHQSSCSNDILGTSSWEIEAARITFANPSWNKFVSDTLNVVCQELGVPQFANTPKCSLHSLRLYPIGSWFSPEPETDESNGVFGTITFVLPSCFTGGLVRLTHDTSTKDFDFGLHSISTTNTLAWYSEVIHDMEPITSGYQLVLVYKLIHTSPEIRRPKLPNNEAAVTELRSILWKWSMGEYSDATDIKFLAYLMKHKYSSDDERDNAALEDEALKVHSLHAVAQELGYVVKLANLSYHVSGVAEAEDPRSRHGTLKSEQDGNEDGDEDDEYPSMSRVTETEISVDYLMDFDGVQMLGTEDLPLDEKQLIPQNPFANVDPDEYETYSSSLDYYYYRKVFVIFHEDNILDILLAAGGVSYAQKYITENASPDKASENLKMVEYILRCANENTQKDIRALRVVADYAMQQKDFDMWRRAVERAISSKCFSWRLLGKEHMHTSCDTFSFASVQPIFEKILTSSPTFEGKIEQLQSLRGQPSDEDNAQWCKEQLFSLVKSLKKPPIKHIDMLVSVILSDGLSIVDEIILPQWGNAPSSFMFWSQFITVVYQNKTTLIKPNMLAHADRETSARPTDDTDDEAEEESKRVFQDVMTQCFNAAIRQWDQVPLLSTESSTSATYIHGPGSAQNPDPRQPVFARVIELMELCITSRNLTALTSLILVIVRCKGQPKHNFQTLYCPLILLLHPLLKKHNLDLHSRPFGDLLRILVGMYLSTVLGAKTRQAGASVRKIGCGCIRCKPLDAFMSSHNLEIKFSVSNHRREHLEKQANGARDLIDFTTLTSFRPHVLVITKRLEFTATIEWQKKQGEAERFLSLIGDDQVIAKLMGDRYSDVKKALEGTLYAMKLASNNLKSTDVNTLQITDVPTTQSQAESIQVSITPIQTADDVGPATVKRKRNDEATMTVTASPDVAEAKSKMHDVLTTGRGSNAINHSQPSSSSVAEADRSLKPSMSAKVPVTKQVEIHPALSPKKPKSVSHDELENRPKLVTQHGKSTGSPQSPLDASQRRKMTTASSSTPLGVKMERLGSSSTRKKRKIESYNLIGHVIVISDDE